MVRPENFGFNPETANNNAFQKNDGVLSPMEISERAQLEFDTMTSSLMEQGVNIIIVEDTLKPIKTDAVFPNNWFTTHADGHLYVYPMYSPNRRLERRDDIIASLINNYGYRLRQELLSVESKGRYLEGTGSMILDREHKKIYACISERTHPILLQKYGLMKGYEVIAFHANDKNNKAYYHTNVIMTLCRHIAIICLESIADKNQRNKLIYSLQQTGKEIIPISMDQVEQFAGNMLEVSGAHEKSLLVMSTSAFNSLDDEQIMFIEKHHIISHHNLSTIEKYGGGSARCMMAEIFIPAV